MSRVHKELRLIIVVASLWCFNSQHTHTHTHTFVRAPQAFTE